MNNENCNALTRAYNCVMLLGWNHSRIQREYGITYPTLRRVRDGRRVKSATKEYCMEVFLIIINTEFRNDRQNNGGDNSAFFHRTFREILLAEYNLNEVK